MSNDECRMTKAARNPNRACRSRRKEASSGEGLRHSRQRLGLRQPSAALGTRAANPNRIASSSPGLRAPRYPGWVRAGGSNPNGVASDRAKEPTQPRWGCRPSIVLSQGSAPRATLGWRLESRWDSKPGAARLVGNAESPLPHYKTLPRRSNPQPHQSLTLRLSALGLRLSFGLRTSDFVIRASSFFRHLAFVIRHFPRHEAHSH
jgi:hypothetical protein